ncbi:hypothetical protein C0992_001844 [Termitomyces sp. T32_za158]|nr:hypothetical protein C0992_001844 [Termitomyces sp. T32_za158]
MATHDASNGTGGLDGSIVYELDRPENFGAGFTSTLSDFEVYPNKYVSRADIISLAAVFAVATCGGPLIPYRGGRTDVWQAGPFGVPQPQEDIQTHIGMFARQGFTKAEMIQLTACGHTMGGVRSTDFPDLVHPNPASSGPVFHNFDTTTQSFDDKVILERMINTVAHGVTLTEEIQVIPAKVHDVQLTFEKSNLVFKAAFRLQQNITSNVNKNRVVTMLWCDRYGSSQDCNGNTRSALPATTTQEQPNLSPISQSKGFTFINYNFIVPINPNASLSKFWFTVDEKDGSSPTTYKNGGDGYPLAQDQLLFVPSLSRNTLVQNSSLVARGGGSPVTGLVNQYTIVAAVRDGSNPSRVYMDALDLAINGFTSSLNTTVDLALNTSITPTQGYSFYAGTIQDSGYQLTLDIHSLLQNGTIYTEDFKQTSQLNTPYVAPTNVTSSKSSSPNSSTRPASVFMTHLIGCVVLVAGVLPFAMNSATYNSRTSLPSPPSLNSASETLVQAPMPSPTRLPSSSSSSHFQLQPLHSPPNLPSSTHAGGIQPSSSFFRPARPAQQPQYSPQPSLHNEEPDARNNYPLAPLYISNHTHSQGQEGHSFEHSPDRESRPDGKGDSLSRQYSSKRSHEPLLPVVGPSHARKPSVHSKRPTSPVKSTASRVRTSLDRVFGLSFNTRLSIDSSRNRDNRASDEEAATPTRSHHNYDSPVRFYSERTPRGPGPAARCRSRSPAPSHSSSLDRPATPPSFIATPPIPSPYPLSHTPRFKPSSSKPIRNYTIHPSRNRFFLAGRLLTGGDTPFAFIASLSLAVGLAGLWFSTTCVFWWRHSAGGKAMVVVGAYLVAVVLSTMLTTATTDPGILPRGLDPDPPYPTMSPSDGSVHVPMPRDLKVRAERGDGTLLRCCVAHVGTRGCEHMRS